MNDFEFEERQLFTARTRIAALYLAVPLVLSFALVDIAYLPIDNQLKAFISRSIVIPVALAVIFFLKRYPNFALDILLAYLGIYTAWLVHLSGDELSSYWAGLPLVTLGTFTFIPNFGHWHAARMNLLTYGPWISLMLWKWDNLNISELIPKLCFVVSNIFMGFIISTIIKNARKVSFDAKKEAALHEAELKHLEIRANLGLFAAGIAHEFGNTLSGIETPLIGIKMRSEQSDKNIRSFEIVERSMRHCRELIDCLGKTSGSHDSLSDLDLKKTIDTSILVQRGHLSETSVVENHVSPDTRVLCSSVVLIQAINNILLNAAQAGASRFSIRGDAQAIHIEDNGPGIDPKIADKLFEYGSTTKKTGSGIGLSFSRKQLRSVGSDLVLTSMKDPTIFTIVFTKGNAP